MKKLFFAICFIFGLFFTANAQQPNSSKTTGNDIVNSLRKIDTKQNSCYTNDGKEGRFRPTERTTTNSNTNSNGSSYNSGSRSYTGSTGASVGTNTSANMSASQTYNTGSSSRNNSNSSSSSTTTKEVCVDKDKLPLYK